MQALGAEDRQQGEGVGGVRSVLSDTPRGEVIEMGQQSGGGCQAVGIAPEGIDIGRAGRARFGKAAGAAQIIGVADLLIE